MVKLTILIATMPSRAQQLERLMAVLRPQMCNEVEFITDSSLSYNIGAKRNKLLQLASGEYIVFVDDDDLISPEYIRLILSAITTNPDCVGISGQITINGGIPKQWHISKEYGYWFERDGIYFRTPNHISPVRRELALQTIFPEIEFGEDADYSRRLLPLLQTEVIIKENIYLYEYKDK